MREYRISSTEANTDHADIEYNFISITSADNCLSLELGTAIYIESPNVGDKLRPKEAQTVVKATFGEGGGRISFVAGFGDYDRATGATITNDASNPVPTTLVGVDSDNPVPTTIVGVDTNNPLQTETNIINPTSRPVPTMLVGVDSSNPVPVVVIEDGTMASDSYFWFGVDKQTLTSSAVTGSSGAKYRRSSFMALYLYEPPNKLKITATSGKFGIFRYLGNGARPINKSRENPAGSGMYSAYDDGYLFPQSASLSNFEIENINSAADESNRRYVRVYIYAMTASVTVEITAFTAKNEIDIFTGWGQVHTPSSGLLSSAEYH